MTSVLALTILTFLLVVVLVFYLMYLLLRTKNPLVDRLADLEHTNPMRSHGEAGEPSQERSVEKVFEPLSNLVPKSPQEVSATAKKLMSAGFRSSSAVTIFFGIRTFMILLAPIILYLSGKTDGMEPGQKFMVFAVCMAGGYMLPGFILSTRVSARQDRIQLALPDTLDLLVVCVEAGLGLDQAMQKTSEELIVAHPDFCQELNLVNLEMRAGKPRREALKHLADRTGIDDISSLVSMLVQADKFGTSIAQSLRINSDTLRTKRRQRAEEKAHKISVKLVFPLVFLIFPAMFVVILGPGVIVIMEQLFPALK